MSEREMVMVLYLTLCVAWCSDLAIDLVSGGHTGLCDIM